MSQENNQNESYKPANSPEGLEFVQDNCGLCQNFRDCNIWGAAMLYDKLDQQYPKEWVWRDGKPACLSYKKI